MDSRFQRLSRSIISSERNDRKMVKMKKKGKTGPRHIPAAPLHGDWQERLRRRTEQREFIRTACENPRGNCCINVKKLLSIRRHDPHRTTPYGPRFLEKKSAVCV